MTPSQCAAARGLLDWTVTRLAEESQVSAPALYRYERGETDLIRVTKLAVLTTFQKRGISFFEENGTLGLRYPKSLDPRSGG
jgi:hypothetical protein